MNAAIKLFSVLGTFFIPVGLVYGFVTGFHEPVGVVALLLLVPMMWMVAFYLRATVKRLPGLGPEDNPRGEIADAEGDYGFFAPQSWWPIVAAGAAAMVFMGLAVGWWFFLLALILGVIGLLGWVFEFFQGPHHV
ncbi:cytochrome c oxidase subunit 4 [Arsenicicoccus dermatophilus]|uniref:cytochrome c oxidase subunit 4 n=1 Tax=Arsenicicoccus dermatophilus TaxID=1076331 RepID=UPI001F4C70AF|nr:cytochrome c oxidase subunit 4 [Arsenicicoccus dermatophilus]MCH8612675.1 cytochrome c oxidase subunit 4 [Arsenicicoccus dermatophilus]